MGRETGIILSEKKNDELRRALKTTKDARSLRAMTGVLLRTEGHTAKQIGRILGVSTKQIFMWCKAYREKGIGGLMLRKPPGRPAWEGNKARSRIPELLMQDPRAFGYLKGRWVVRDIAKQLKDEGINLSFQSVDRILHDIGISLKRPKLGAPGSLQKDQSKRREIANHKAIAAALEKKG